MSKIFLTILWIAMVFFLVLTVPAITLAATLTFNNNTTVSLPNGRSLTISNGSKAESITINDDSTISVSLAADSNITFNSSEARLMSVSGGTSSGNICNSSTGSSITITSATTQTAVLTLLDTFCQFSGSGSAESTPVSGGGGGGTITVPSNTSIKINNGAATTSNREVTLTLAATDATLMMVSEKSDFTDVTTWETYATLKTITLSEGLGVKTVYAKFRSSAGGTSSAVSDTIELVLSAIVLPAAASGDVSSYSGGSVALADNSVKVEFPAAAISGSGTLNIDPTTNYIGPGGTKTVVGGKVYDINLTVDGNTIKNFDKEVTLTFQYTAADVRGVDELTLVVRYWDETQGEWVLLGGVVNAADNTITVKTNHFTKFAVVGEVISVAGDLLKYACPTGALADNPCKAVYYLGSDNKRYVFPNEKAYKTWYPDFSGVKVISKTELESYTFAIGAKGQVTYKPGVKLVKFNTDPKVYAVAAGGVLRWVTTEAVATALYGSTWNKQIDDLLDTTVSSYTVGSDISDAASFNKTNETANATSISVEKDL